MAEGYSLPVVDGSTTYDDLVSGFEWNVPEVYNIAGAVQRTADERPAATALAHADDDGGRHEFTYAELDDAATTLAARLAAAGLERGDRIAVCFPQSPELLVSHLAIYRTGCIAVPLSVILGDDSARHSLTHSGADALLVDSQIHEELEGVVAELDLRERLVVDVSGGRYDGPTRHLGGYADRVDGNETHDVVETASDDPALIVYTSGTSGKPKGVVQAHQYLIGALPSYRLWFQLFDDHHRERVWTPAEWSWAGALFDVVFPTLAMGGTVVSHGRRSGFDPRHALRLVGDLDVSRAFLPPTALSQMKSKCDPSSVDLSCLEVIMCGGEKCSVSLRHWAERELDVVVNESYGQTEANALIGNCQALFDARDDSMGKPYPGHACRVVDEDGEPVDAGEAGEIVLDLPDPVVFEGYWDDEATTAERFADGQYLTGDLATVDEDGYLYFVGRSDDVIISAGYRVSPAEVESALCDLPSVNEAAVGGVPDEERGQRIKAFAFPADGTEPPSPERLRQHVRSTLGPHKAPDEVELLAEPPTTRSGKLDRSALFPD
ncbi:acyl-CoA synthetase [Halomicrobium urmianum]|uniref:acyl-CoA synthetase n=1 Tax=Halomicrobium urmianum TaxID=1586233 RepID=UPI001CDA1C9D|nr:AMP-binding protein [Halomicrobium urmianum]